MKIYKSWSYQKYLWLVLGAVIILLAFLSIRTNTPTDVVLILVGVGIACIVSGLLSPYCFYGELSNGRITKVSFYLFKLEMEVSQIKEVGVDWNFGNQLYILGGDKYGLYRVEFHGYLYKFSSMAEIVRDLKELRPSIQLDEKAQQLLDTGTMDVQKMYAWEFWNK